MKKIFCKSGNIYSKMEMITALNNNSNVFIGSVRCGSRLQKRDCDNKEIRKVYIEKSVLSELERNILNDKAIPILVKQINKHI